MGAYKFIVGLAIICFLSAFSSNCKERSSFLGGNIKHGRRSAKREDSKKSTEQVQVVDSKKEQPSRKKLEHHQKPPKGSSKYISNGRSLKSNKLVPSKSEISIRSADYKARSKTKKFSVSFSPNSNLNLQQQTNNYEAYSPGTSTEAQYSTSSQSAGDENQQMNQQQEYSFMNSGQENINKLQESNNGDIQNKQSVGAIQELMEQRAAMFGQQSADNQEGEQRSYEQQSVRYQGQDSDEQQNISQEEPQQYQEMDRESPSQQMAMQAGTGQDNQETQIPQEGDAAQQGTNQVVSYQTGQENGDEQTNQLENQLQQESSHETESPQGVGEGGYLIKGGDPDQSYKGTEDQGETYQPESNAVQQNGAQLPNGSLESGSIANIFSDSVNPGSRQETQSFISEGQRITSTDAAQLAEAIENANKGLKGYKEENSLASVASNNANALSFTEGQQSDSEVSQTLPTSKEMHDFQDVDNGIMFQQNSGMNFDPMTNSQINSGEPSQFHHYQEGDDQREESTEYSVANQAAKYCTGCPRNARCIDKVCIIASDEPLAKILGALSGPGNETSDCKGCHHNARCVKKECICKPGYSGDGTDCRADSCLPGCSKHGKCIRGFCVCDHHHYFNGIECAPYKISPTVCPQTCETERCCKSNLHGSTTAKPTSKISTQSKKIGAEAASSFYLKPTLHRIDEVFHQHPHGEKPTTSHKQTESNKMSTENRHDNKAMTTDSNVQNYQTPKLPGNKDTTISEKVTTKCQPECSSAHCSPSCPDHCCNIYKTGLPNLKLNQMNFLKSIAERFCPISCQTSCNNACPPICCDRKALSSLLGSSPGSSVVDLSKAEDVFRNAMGWFGMMNLLHMMYSMYDKRGPVGSRFVNSKPTNSITTKGMVPESCSPICKKTCLLSCPRQCCTLGSKPTKPSEKSLNSQTKSLNRLIPGKTACPVACALHCLQPCSPACCLSKSNQATKPAANKLKSCKPGCSSVCFPKCSDACCNQTSSKPVPRKAPYGCPSQCPKPCYPSCARECCLGTLVKKASLLSGRVGQYYVNIPCPIECRPYNCLSYCHHECCLRSLKKNQVLNSGTTNSNSTTKSAT